jgi:hypothetical protein
MFMVCGSAGRYGWSRSSEKVHMDHLFERLELWVTRFCTRPLFVQKLSFCPKTPVFSNQIQRWFQ